MYAEKKVFKETDPLKGIPRPQILTNFITIITDRSFTKKLMLNLLKQVRIAANLLCHINTAGTITLIPIKSSYTNFLWLTTLLFYKEMSRMFREQRGEGKNNAKIAKPCHQATWKEKT